MYKKGDLIFNCILKVQFSLIQNSDSPIKIDPRDGTVYVNGRLDREKTPLIRVKVVARDGGLFDADDQV